MAVNVNPKGNLEQIVERIEELAGVPSDETTPNYLDEKSFEDRLAYALEELSGVEHPDAFANGLSSLDRINTAVNAYEGGGLTPVQLGQFTLRNTLSKKIAFSGGVRVIEVDGGYRVVSASSDVPANGEKLITCTCLSNFQNWEGFSAILKFSVNASAISSADSLSVSCDDTMVNAELITTRATAPAYSYILIVSSKYTAVAGDYVVTISAN